MRGLLPSQGLRAFLGTARKPEEHRDTPTWLLSSQVATRSPMKGRLQGVLEEAGLDFGFEG